MKRTARALGLVVLGLFSAAILAGPVRAVTKLPLVPATVVAALVACVALWLWRARSVPSLSNALWLVTFAVFGAASFVSRWGPLVGWVGSDGGVHVSFRDDFVTNDPHAYSGFVSFYGFTWWIDRIFPTDAYGSFAVGTLLVAALVAAGAAWSSQRGLELGKARPLPIVLTALCAMLVLGGIALPVVAYYQTDGFFAQIWILVPLAAIWLVDTSALSRGRRAVLLALCYVLVRYTYGLVLGDLCVLGLVFVVTEAILAKRRGEAVLPWIGACVLVAAGVVLVEWRFMKELLEVVPRYGWFIDHDFPRSQRGILLAVVGLGIAAIAHPALGRFVLVPLVVTVVNTVTVSLLRLRFPGDHYYIFKYDFHAVVLLALATCAAVGCVLAQGVAPRRSLVAGVATALALVGCFEVSGGLARMRSAFLERAFDRGAIPTTGGLQIRALVDRGATRRIYARLRRSHGRFGGFLVPWGPMFNFVNAELHRMAGGYFAFRGVDHAPGSCVFWTHGEGPSFSYWEMPDWMKREEARLDRTPGVECTTYPAPGDPRIHRDLCSVCFPAAQ